MDRVLIIATLGFALVFFIVRQGTRITKERAYEILIAIYTFSCCFTMLYVPIFKVATETEGSFGASLSIWPFYLMSVLLIWIIAREKRWRIRRPNLWLFLIFAGYAVYTLLNPNNPSRGQTVVATFFLISFAVFMYLFTNTFTVKNVVNGIFMGLAATVILHFLLAMCYPVLGMENVVKLYVKEASSRSVERIGANCTMGHPNVLGTYASYYFIFFVATYITAYKRRASLVFAGMSFLVIVLSASRSALLASFFSLLAVAALYVLRRYRLMSFQSIFKGIIPLGIIIALLLTGPLSFLFSNVDDLDEMTTSRLMHYYCGYEIFIDHPIVGVGLNSHLVYLVENSSAVMLEQIFDTADIYQPEEFMFSNPIHNIWIILIDELGILGFLPILCFVIWYIATFKLRTRRSRNRYYNILNMSGLGVICCWLVQGNTDWAPLTPQVLSLSLMFIALSLNRHYAAEEHPEFESVEAARQRLLEMSAREEQEEQDEEQEQPSLSTITS